MRFMENKGSDIDRALSSLSSTLLRSIAREAIRADPVDCVGFQAKHYSEQARELQAVAANDLRTIGEIHKNGVEVLNV